MTPKYLIEISQNLEDMLLKYSSQTPFEVCGILIGKEINSQNILVTDIIYDNGALNPSAFSITRNTKNLFPKVKDIVEKSVMNKVDFIGDWHSHPNGSSIYSTIDHYAMMTMLKDPDYLFLNSIVLIIVCPPNIISAFLFLRNKQRPIKMEIKIS